MHTLATALLTGTVLAAASFAVPIPADAATPAPAAPTAVLYKFKNCTAMNRVYPHGVGKKGARNHTSGTRVKTFKVSTSLYTKIVRHRSGLDRDKDGIACEKA